MRFLLVLIFIVVPIAELALLIQVGQTIGVWWTIALLIADSILGSLLMRSQGRAAWRRFNVSLQAGRPPAREVLDGVLVIFGGALLLTPGFISDFLGLLLLLPPTRAVVRRILVRRFADRMIASATSRGRRSASGLRPGAAAPAGPATSRARPSTSTPTACRGARDERAGADRRRGLHRRRHLRVRRPRRRVLRARARGRRLRPRRAAGQRARRAVRRPRAGRGARRGRHRARRGGGLGRAAAARARSCGRSSRTRAGRSWSTPRRERASTSSSRPCRRRPSSRRTTTRRASAAWPATSSSAASPAPRPGSTIDCLGQRGRTWGIADWSRIALTRSLAAWLEDGSSLTVAAVRPTDAESHADEATWGALLDADGTVAARRPARLDDLRRRRPPAPRRPRAVGRRGGRLPAPRRRPGAVRLVRRARAAAARLRVLRLAARRPRGRRALRPGAPGLAGNAPSASSRASCRR